MDHFYFATVWNIFCRLDKICLTYIYKKYTGENSDSREIEREIITECGSDYTRLQYS